MKQFKYIGIISLLLFCFYYTEKVNNMVIYNSNLAKEINNYSKEYEILPVSAYIDGDYIIPGLNGYIVNVIKSYGNMKPLNSFNYHYLVYDEVIPSISLSNNKDKIIKYGNKYKNSVSIIVKDNYKIIDYSLNNNINITRLINKDTININNKYEQINNDYEYFDLIEKILNKNNINKNICFINKDINNKCNNKYLVTQSLIVNNYNLVDIKNNIESGLIILIDDRLSLAEYKILVRQIYYQDLSIISLSELIKEERT